MTFQTIPFCKDYSNGCISPLDELGVQTTDKRQWLLEHEFDIITDDIKLFYFILFFVFLYFCFAHLCVDRIKEEVAQQRK